MLNWFFSCSIMVKNLFGLDWLINFFNLRQTRLKWLKRHLCEYVHYCHMIVAHVKTIPNYILYTNAKLFKIGLSLNDNCTFCDSSKEELHHLFFECSHAQIFWKTFSSWWFELVKENITMTLKDIILGLLNRTDIINYLIILGKLCIWECRKAGIYPDFKTIPTV